MAGSELSSFGDPNRPPSLPGGRALERAVVPDEQADRGEVVAEPVRWQLAAVLAAVVLADLVLYARRIFRWAVFFVALSACWPLGILAVGRGVRHGCSAR